MPGAVGVNVGGVRAIRPGVYTTVDASSMIPLTDNPMGVVGVIAPSDGGTPGQVYEFRSMSEAVRVLRGGAVLSYLSRIFSPSPDRPGAGLVRFVRIGAPTRAGVAGAGMTFASVDYGRHTCGYSVEITGSTNAWTVTLRKRIDGFSRTIKVGPGIQVKSTATTPKIVFDHAALQMKMYENAAVVATMDYPTDSVMLAQAIAFINGRSGWTAQIAPGADPSMPVRFMDNPILGSAPSILTTFTDLPANQGALEWILKAGTYGVTCALTSGSTYAALSAVSETYMTNGTGTANDVFVTSDWNAALTTMSTVDVQFLFLATTDANAANAGYLHCVDMRTVNKKRYRIFFTGGGLNQTAAAAAAAAPAFDGPCVYVWNGTTTPNPLTGVPENLGGLGSAAQVCGLAAGSYASEPVTGKSLVSSNLETPAPTDSDVETMLIAGVCPITLDPVTGRTRVEQAVTTWQGGTNVAFRKLLGLRIQDEIQRGFQRVLSDFVGYPLDIVTGNAIRARIAKFLDNSVRTAQNSGGFLTPGIVNGQARPAWENLSVSGDGMESWDIQVECHPVGETTYIRVAVKLTPAQIQL